MSEPTAERADGAADSSTDGSAEDSTHVTETPLGIAEEGTASAAEAAVAAQVTSGYDRAADKAIVRAQRRKDTLQALVGTVLTIALALALCFVLLLVLGKNPVTTYEWLLTGPFSRTTRMGRVLMEATTLTILGLSVAIPFRAGLMSLGAEGQLYMGALAATVVSLSVPMPPGLGIIVPMLAAASAGALVGFIPGWMKAKLGANELVSSLMLNAVLVRLYSWVLTNFLTKEGATSVASDYLPENSTIPTLTQIFGVPFDQANLAILLIPVLTVVVWTIMHRTPLGFEARMFGSNQRFARYGGIRGSRVVILSFVVSGAIAGLAGAHLVQGVNGRALLTLSTGAFDGIMIAILARNNPLVIPVAALLYAYLKVGGFVLEQEASVGTEIVNVIQALIVLLVTSQFVIGFLRRRKAEKKASA